MKKIGFIGMGNMGYAMLGGCLNVLNKEELVFTDVSKTRCEAVSKETGVDFVEGNAACAKLVKYIVLAVKPQFYHLVLADLKDVVTKDQVIISIAPGISIDSLKESLGSDIRIVRAMPNTPALVGEGMAGVCMSDDTYTDEEKAMVEAYFTSFGKMEWIDEKLLSAVTVASGSSPAFVYMFIEALADGAVRYGIPRDKAYKFVAQAVLGSAKMVLETGEHPGKLKDNVCSPGGTTIDGVAALEDCGFRNAIIQGAKAVYDKCENIK